MMRNRGAVLGCRAGSEIMVVFLLAILAIVATAGVFTASSDAQAATPPGFAQGFSEIVKKVTPAVVNIAVTGGEGGKREGRRPLPPGPFGPPGGPPDEPG